MENQKHTPAPWENTVLCMLAHNFQLDSGLFAKFIEAPRERVKPALVFGETEEQTNANAKLIASAPELLEALIEANEMLRIFADKNKAGDGSSVGRCMEKMQNAIKKATE